jgi:hypothetical protein
MKKDRSQEIKKRIVRILGVIPLFVLGYLSIVVAAIYGLFSEIITTNKLNKEHG